MVMVLLTEHLWVLGTGLDVLDVIKSGGEKGALGAYGQLHDSTRPHAQ